MEQERAELYFKEYKKLKGQDSKQEYFYNLRIFLDETMDIFVHGLHTKYDSRWDSMYGVCDLAHISIEEVDKILESVDNVDSYT
tara:strand:- start:339 stop:590 length:252 start_codon:yes stop_codon:yes gene_type:complete